MQRIVKRKTVSNKVNKLTDFTSQEDVFGSYTGVDSTDRYEVPVQDADDL